MLHILLNNNTLYMTVIFIVLASSVFWLFAGIFAKDVSIFLRIVMIIVGILAVLVMIDKHVYLPFLGETVYPTGLLEVTKQPIQSPDTVTVTLKKIPANSHVIYWASLPMTSDKSVQPWKKAYGDFINGGITKADAIGNATVTLYCPKKYYVRPVGIKRVLPQHIHYRYALPNNKGMMSRVYTTKISCGQVMAEST